MDRLAYMILAGPQVRAVLALRRLAPTWERPAPELELQTTAAQAVGCCAELGAL